MENPALTLKDFRRLTADLSDDLPLSLVLETGSYPIHDVEQIGQELQLLGYAAQFAPAGD